MPHFRLEREAGGRVAGVDEAGRGPLAGPVLAAAVVFPRGVPRRLAKLIDDSKALAPREREDAYRAMRVAGCVEWAVGAASAAEIGRLNILRATQLAMVRAIARLPTPPDLVLVDGNQPPRLALSVRGVIGGDALSLSIAAASIFAKVTRDRAMTRLCARWPGYGFGQHMGYATREHRAALSRLGPTPHHRRGFASVEACFAGPVEACFAGPVEACFAGPVEACFAGPSEAPAAFGVAASCEHPPLPVGFADHPWLASAQAD